jgi:hypothetical protein
VVIAAADPKRPPVIRGGASGLQLSDPVHVVLRDLRLEGARGNGVNVDDGGTFDTPARGVVLERITVRDVGPDGNRDGIKLSGVVDFVVRGCRVERWGRGGSAIDMVGCRNGVIEDCVFRHENAARASGVQTKGGSRAITVRYCRFEHAGGRAINMGGGTGKAYFRPRPAGFEARDITVEDCTIVGSPVAFVGVDGGVFRHNTIYRPRRWVLRILQETRDDGFAPCRNVRFERNIVAFRQDELRAIVNIGPGTDPASFRFVRNLWFCIDRPAAGATVPGKLPGTVVRGVHDVDPGFADPERGDLRARKARDHGPRPRRDA